VLTYTLCGFIAGVAGMLMAASIGVISPNLGVGSEFFTIAAVVLGGTRLSGGVGRVEKTLLGAFILYMVLNYMTLRHIPTEWQQAATGFLVLVAIILDRLAQRGRSGADRAGLTSRRRLGRPRLGRGLPRPRLRHRLRGGTAVFPPLSPEPRGACRGQASEDAFLVALVAHPQPVYVS